MSFNPNKKPFIIFDETAALQTKNKVEKLHKSLKNQTAESTTVAPGYQ